MAEQDENAIPQSRGEGAGRRSTRPHQTPVSLTFEDGKEYPIDRVCSRQRAAATKVGGTGIRYTIMIGGRQTYLFEDEDQWFVEAKNLHV